MHPFLGTDFAKLGCPTLALQTAKGQGLQFVVDLLPFQHCHQRNYYKKARTVNVVLATTSKVLFSTLFIAVSYS